MCIRDRAYDELELDTLGDRKTALFLIMSDTDDSFNFLISMCYTCLLYTSPQTGFIIAYFAPQGAKSFAKKAKIESEPERV